MTPTIPEASTSSTLSAGYLHTVCAVRALTVVRCQAPWKTEQRCSPVVPGRRGPPGRGLVARLAARLAARRRRLLPGVGARRSSPASRRRPGPIWPTLRLPERPALHSRPAGRGRRRGRRRPGRADQHDQPVRRAGRRAGAAGRRGSRHRRRRAPARWSPPRSRGPATCPRGPPSRGALPARRRVPGPAPRPAAEDAVVPGRHRAADTGVLPAVPADRTADRTGVPGRRPAGADAPGGLPRPPGAWCPCCRSPRGAADAGEFLTRPLRLATPSRSRGPPAGTTGPHRTPRSGPVAVGRSAAASGLRRTRWRGRPGGVACRAAGRGVSSARRPAARRVTTGAGCCARSRQCLDGTESRAVACTSSGARPRVPLDLVVTAL